MLRKTPLLLLGASITLDESLLTGLQATWTKGKEELCLPSAVSNTSIYD